MFRFVPTKLKRKGAKPKHFIREVAMKEFTQLVVWQGTTCGEERAKEFEEWMFTEMGARVKYHAEVRTFPDMHNGIPVAETGGRNDLFFYVHSDDEGKFAIKRFAYQMRWWEDVLGNGGGKLYPQEFLDANPPTWNFGIIKGAQEEE